MPPAVVEHAGRFYARGGKPTVPRVAATVVLLRPAPAGFEAYLIRRSPTMVFGGMYAFPGGAVDPSDSQAPLGWVGPSPADWGARLALTPGSAQALVCAAVREVFEEAGVLLAGPGPTAVAGDVSGDDWEAARRALVNRDIGFADLLRRRRLHLRSDLLAPWSRWITPEYEPHRFDTYFFVAVLPEGQRTRDVSGEADHTLWIRPAEALARADAGEMTMLPPTRVTLETMTACPDIPAVLAAAAERDAANPVNPAVTVHGDGRVTFTVPN